MYVCVSKGKKYLFFGKVGVLSFLETPVLRFALLPYFRRNKSKFSEEFIKLVRSNIRLGNYAHFVSNN